jgi:hypothetical protein
LAILLADSACGTAQTSFTAAVFNGIIMGRSKVADVVKRFGAASDIHLNYTETELEKDMATLKRLREH